MVIYKMIVWILKLPDRIWTKLFNTVIHWYFKDINGNHCIHQCRIQTHPLRTGLCTDRTREREIRKHHLGRNLKENNRMKSILQMYINK